eukprot:CAMPEP_0184692132 /NCGR_PEP_ID=MMETSP0313-20130426/740_1 /TAXON_ID=2792 /ORGANISM="Porphyridium aerugineum, Strain SAG 1380-2" /LENGTH=94 /DNA_ID=CAMNT_0027149941 /DNA_START=274 /DNA_END=558 /DNA_ORIENTATION=-
MGLIRQRAAHNGLNIDPHLAKKVVLANLVLVKNLEHQLALFEIVAAHVHDEIHIPYWVQAVVYRRRTDDALVVNFEDAVWVGKPGDVGILEAVG